MTDWTDEETDDPHHADRRNFYKVQKWAGTGCESNSCFTPATALTSAAHLRADHMHRPRIRLMIRQRMRVLDEWPRHETML